MDVSAEAASPRVATDYERKFGGCEELEARITELWAYLNAATHRFLKLIGEYDQRKAYERHGLVNTAQWLNWQCGIGTLAAREKVRVARALGSLPSIDAAFANGEVSYSKVRAITRVATSANEAALLNIARHGTASHVEKLVRKYRWTQRRDAGKLAKDQHAGREAYFFYDDTDTFVLHARLPPEVGAIVLKALQMAGDVLRDAKRSEVSAETGEGSAGTSARVSAETPPKVSAETGTRTTSGVWTEDQLESSSAAKRADALRLVAETFLNCRAEEMAEPSSADRYQLVVHVDQAVLTDEIAACADEPHRCELDAGPALALDTARRLGCDCTLVGMVDGKDGEPLSVGRKTRAIPEAIRRALRSRDGGCRFPGCDRTRFTDGHHVKHWADGGETKLSNLVTLCGFHHMLVHEGGYGVAATDDGVFVFTRPDGRRITSCGPPARVAHAATEESFRGNFASRYPENSERRSDDEGQADLDPFERSLRSYMRSLDPNLRIDSRTGNCQWLGEKMDYSLAIEGLQCLDGVDSPRPRPAPP